MVRKIQYFQPQLGEFIKKDYFPVGASVYARWLHLEKPLALPLIKISDFDSTMALLKNWVGASTLPEITALVEAKGRPSRILQLRAEDLLSAKIVGKKSRITAVSPFTKIDPITDLLPEVVRFDWDWTGVSDLTDDIPNDTLLPKAF
jgi:hypothetical protein